MGHEGQWWCWVCNQAAVEHVEGIAMCRAHADEFRLIDQDTLAGRWRALEEAIAEQARPVRWWLERKLDRVERLLSALAEAIDRYLRS